MKKRAFFATITVAFIMVVTMLSTLVNAGEDDSIAMQEVVISATKTEQEVLDVSQHVTVISGEEIEKSGAGSVSEVLDARTGIVINDYGPKGASQNVSMRGSTSAQVLILVDGVRMNSALSGGVDLSLIPVDNIERIEIVRGGSSALHGADAMGGVINIITKKKADNRLKVSIENGSFLPGRYVTGYSTDKTEEPADYTDIVDSQKARIAYSRKLGKISLTTAGSIERAKNGYIYKDTNLENRKRDNAELLGVDVSAGVRFPAGEGTVDITGSFVRNKKGIPGSITSPTPEASQEDRRVQTSADFHTDRFFSELLSFNIKTYVISSELQYKSPSIDVDSDHKTNSAGLDLVQEMLFFNRFSIIYGGNMSYDSVKSTDVGAKDRTYGGGFVETPIFVTDSLTLQPAVRYDYYSDFKGDLNFKLGSVYRLSSTTSIKGSIAKSFRAPTMNDLYWPTDSFAEGNPDLKPETGYSIDFGATHTGERLRFDLFGYMRYVNDVILWQPGDDGLWRPSNWGEALYPGIESSLQVRLREGVWARLDYGFLYTFALSGGLTMKDNKRLPLIPVHSLNLGLDLQRGKSFFSLSTKYESLRYEKVSNASYLPSYTVVDVLYRRKYRHVSWFAAVDNLFNEQYEVVPLYPMPGTFVRSGVELTF